MQIEALIEVTAICRVSKEVDNFTPPAEIVLSPAGKIPLRNIFSFQLYSAVEQEKLKRLKTEITKSRMILPAEWDDAALMRVIHGSGYKTRRAFKDLKESIETISKLIPPDYRMLFPKSLELLVRNN